MAKHDKHDKHDKNDEKRALLDKKWKRVQQLEHCGEDVMWNGDERKGKGSQLVDFGFKKIVKTKSKYFDQFYTICSKDGDYKTDVTKYADSCGMSLFDVMANFPLFRHEASNSFFMMGGFVGSISVFTGLVGEAR